MLFKKFSREDMALNEIHSFIKECTSFNSNERNCALRIVKRDLKEIVKNHVIMIYPDGVKLFNGEVIVASHFHDDHGEYTEIIKKDLADIFNQAYDKDLKILVITGQRTIQEVRYENGNLRYGRVGHFDKNWLIEKVDFEKPAKFE